MEQHPNMRRARNILLKCFLITYLLLIISNLIYYLTGMDWVYKLCEKMYHVTPKELGLFILSFLAYMKMVAFLFFLIPALAIHFEYFTCRCKKKEIL